MKFSHITKEALAEDITMFVMSQFYHHPYTHEFMKQLGTEKEYELDKLMIDIVLARLNASADAEE